jgi:hypothetical protein
MTTVGGINAYSWDNQNYTEQWDSTSDTLIGQMYWSMNGTVLTCTVVAPDGSEASSSLDYSIINSQGTTTLADGTQITVDSNGGTFNVTTASGTVSVGSYDSTGAQTLSVRRISGPRQTIGPVTVHVPSTGPGSLTNQQRANIHCVATALIAAAVLAAVIAAAVAAVIAVCAASAVTLCAAAGLLAAGVVAEAIALYKSVVAAACS